MRITAKGQVTIPQEIRKRLGLLPNTEVIFEVDGSAARLRRAPKQAHARGNSIVDRMRGRASGKLSTEDIMALTRGGK